MTHNTDELEQYRNQHIGRFIQKAYKQFNNNAVNRLESNGYKNITPFQAEIISYISLHGSPLKDVVLHIGVSKQAVGEGVLQLENEGYIVKRRDEADKRAYTLFFTSRGIEFLEVADRVKRDIESEYVHILGKADFERLKKILHKLTQ